MKDILQSALDNINDKKEESSLITNKDTIIDTFKFKEIKKTDSKKKVSFIDGGNLEIIKSPSLCLFFNRIYATTYKNNKRIKNHLVEFFSLITIQKLDDKLIYKVKYEFIKNHLELNNYEFDSLDKKLTIQNKRANIELIGDVIRRLAEIKMINMLDTDFVVLDGSLEQVYPYEKELFDNINKKINVCGLSKTNSNLVTTGNSIAPLLLSKTNLDTWNYEFDENNNYKSFFLKLNKNSDYLFKFECENKLINSEVISLLKDNSKDPIFLGYPYGLIEADKFARVTNKEQESLKIKLMLNKEYKKLKPYIKTKDAHSILDNIS